MKRTAKITPEISLIPLLTSALYKQRLTKITTKLAPYSPRNFVDGNNKEKCANVYPKDPNVQCGPKSDWGLMNKSAVAQERTYSMTIQNEGTEIICQNPEVYRQYNPKNPAKKAARKESKNQTRYMIRYPSKCDNSIASAQLGIEISNIQRTVSAKNMKPKIKDPKRAFLKLLFSKKKNKGINPTKTNQGKTEGGKESARRKAETTGSIN